MTPDAAQTLESLRKRLEHDEAATLDEAEEISVGELPPNKQKSVDELTRKLKLQVKQVWDGIHGYIVTFAASPQQSMVNRRVKADELQIIAEVKDLRWVEFDPNTITIGF